MLIETQTAFESTLQDEN